MGLGTATHLIGPATGTLTLHTGRSGFAATVGHDLVIEVTRWAGVLKLDRQRPEASTVQVTVDATSFEVREGSGGAVPLLAVNKSEIGRNIRKVLDTSNHSNIRFESRSIAETTGGFSVAGDLTIVGVTRGLELTVSTDLGDDELRGVVTAEIVQSDFGIKPYSAMFGALKVRDMVEVRVELRL